MQGWRWKSIDRKRSHLQIFHERVEVSQLFITQTLQQSDGHEGGGGVAFGEDVFGGDADGGGGAGLDDGGGR